MDSLLNTSFTPQPALTKHQPKPPEMSSEFSDRRISRLGSRTPELEPLPCPRCDSTNTKFCYYNNYNLSQPRHFCKSCRRYWTRGGTLRNVPVGGGTRKASSSNKRPRIATTTSSNSTSFVSCSSTDNDITGQTQTLDPVVSDPGLCSGSTERAAVDLNGADVAKSGSLGCWWSGQMGGVGGGILPFSGYGLGLGPGMGYENGVLDWPMEQLRGVDGGAAVVPGESPGCNTWQMGGGGEGGISDGDYLSWPELAISTPAKALK
ncbi:hypothetical protein BUALT_Bualt08G0057800 [Buddleja alternifolia]|uniref:Dof zinc finger protein n=1 Tax=Buddleja alternifolia TaxID=168488 RepID=A0AAV6XF11_9LAMI|nr:hypothetical protein BUALT_Bualt08G0057800 [Buddleja alternifolia]